MATNNFRYIMQRVSKRDNLYGVVHGSNSPKETFCGQMLDEKWFLLTNNFSGTVTCKKCLKAIKEGAK